MQALLFVTFPAASIAQEGPDSAATLHTNRYSEQVAAAPDQLQGVPVALEGKAKLAVEQALRKSVDKTKVGMASCPYGDIAFRASAVH